MGPVWFITGSSRGLGVALVEHALKNGDSVFATARNPDKAAALQELQLKHGDSGKLVTYPLDVTDYSSALAAVDEAWKTFGRIDIVINNAGYADLGSVEDTTIESFRTQVETNFYGVINVCKAAVPRLRKQGSGHIFQVSSLGSRLGSPGLSPYQSAKWAVSGFSLCLAAELAPLGVKVTSLEPGAMRTDWAGPSMTIPPIGPAYESTVGAFAKMLRGGAGTETTQPEKVGQIIDALYKSPEPPVRMLVGADAVQYAQAIADGQADSDKKWHDLSKSSA